MLAYNLRLAWKSVRRNPVLSTLIIAGIALGVGISTSFITIYHVFARDPLPAKSRVVHYVRMDSWDPAGPHPHESGIPTQMTYRDVRAVMRSRIPVRQTATYPASLYVFPEEERTRPSSEPVRMVFSDFFPMFEVPFQYGAPWSRQADSKPEPVVVISSTLNDRIFGGHNSVGKTLRIDRGEFRIVGVLAPWRPRLRVYDLTRGPVGAEDTVFLPFNWIVPMEISSAGSRDGWKGLEGDPTFQERLELGESVFLQMWVELADDASRQAYKSFLDAHATEQRKLGRFQRPLDNRVTPLRDLIDEWNIVPPQTRAIAAISILFLIVAALNLVGLFLGKFLARAPSVGIRRAMGASRRSIFVQHLVECELVGLVGGALGLLMSLGVLAAFNRTFAQMTQNEGFFELDLTMIVAAVFLSLIAGAIAGLYPAWRICSIPPAHHLRNQ